MMTNNIKKYDGVVCKDGYYKFNIVGCSYDLNTMMEANNSEKSFALINDLSKQNDKVLDDNYIFSVLEEIENLGSGEDFLRLAMSRINSARYELLGKPENKEKELVPINQIAKLLEELRPDELAQHTISSGCTGAGYPCTFNNGPCCCLVHMYGIEDCPFGQGMLTLDESYAKEKLEKLRSLAPDDEDALSYANKNIAEAREILRQKEERINSSIKARYIAEHSAK